MEYIDLGLPSGTLWANKNYQTDNKKLFTYDETVKLDVILPTKEQWQELIDNCSWQWENNRYTIKGKNGKTIFLPVTGLRKGSELYRAGSNGYYWSASPYELNPSYAWVMYFASDYQDVNYGDCLYGRAVRPVLNKNKEKEDTENKEEFDPVNKPMHYTHGKYESIDVMEDVFGTSAVENFCLCNAFKYLYRCEYKGHKIEDIKKAQWYLNKIVELYEKNKK